MHRVVEINLGGVLNGCHAEAIERYLDDPQRAPFDEIRLALFEHGVEAVGLPPADRWKAVLDRARRQGSFLGVDPEEYPLDFAHLGRYDEALDEIPADYPLPPLAWDDVTSFLDAHADRDALEIQR